MSARLLAIEGLTKRFGGLDAVRDVTFTVDHGSVTGLIGPNGAGKTTLLNLISGVHRPTSGTILFDQRPITNAPTHEMALLGIARTFQQSVLYEDATAMENIQRFMVVRNGPSILSDIFRLPKAREFLAQAEERSRELANFVGLGAYVDTPARSLPYGLRRALGVAMALALDPRLIMLDEPVAGMNPNETADMARLVRKINDNGTSVLVIEHDMSFVMSLCHRIVVLAEGHKIAEGSPADIQADPQVIAAYLGEDDG